MRNKIYAEPPESERKFRRLAKLGQELGVPITETHLEVEVTMPDGRVLKHFKQRSHSYVRNAYNCLFSLMAAKNAGATYGAGLISFKDTSGTIRGNGGGIGFQSGPTVEDIAGGKGFGAPAGVATYGIQVGSNVAAESFEDIALGTLIANGNAAGQLAYAQSEAETMAYVAGTKTLTSTYIRYMNNNSGGDVVVREIALTGVGVNGMITTIDTLFSRDHVADITIPNTGQIKVTYTISLVYPA
jgi:hypothetical protein